MAHDLFISYSRKDSAQALVLAERLRASGIEVWIDQHGIEAGFRNVELFRTDPDLNGLREGSPTIREEIQDLMASLAV